MATRDLLDGRISIKFDNYQAAAASSPPKYNSNDEEVQSDEEHIIAMLKQEFIEGVFDEGLDKAIYVIRITTTTKLPQRKTKGAASYDHAVDSFITIPPWGRALIPTR